MVTQNYRTEAVKTPSLGGVREKGKERLQKDKIAFRQKLNSHIRRLLIILANWLFNYRFVFKIIGTVNKRFGFIESVFLAYPANESYALSYVYHSRLPKVRWNPWSVGFLRQNGKLGIMFVISAGNKDFRDPTNADNLRQVVAKMEDFRLLLNAKRKTFAGILPGILFLKRAIKETHEADTTVKAVGLAIAEVKAREKLPPDCPTIVLGGRGFIGRKVFANLPSENLYCVDTANGCEWPDHLCCQRVLLVNIADNGALDEYVPKLWPGTVVLNEVYPEPKAATVERLKRFGCACYHIQGVKGHALPLFPHAYRGAIPCCSAWMAEQMKVVLLRM